MAQQGSIFESHGSWYLRWWEKVKQEDGFFKWEHQSHRLASKEDYRRGLATNLHELGVPDIVIQAILRHEDVRTTQRSYIKTVPDVVTAAMKRLEARTCMYSTCTAGQPKRFGKLKKANKKPT